MLLASNHYDYTCVLLGRVQLCLSHVRVAQHRESLGHSGDSSLIVHQQTPCFISLTLGRFLPHSREGGWCSARIAGERRLANAACALLKARSGQASSVKQSRMSALSQKDIVLREPNTP